MRKLMILVVIGVAVAGCASTEPPPTATAVPPTNTPLPPTASPIPPTPTPNPDAERILMELSEAINNQDSEAALAMYADDVVVLSPGGFRYEGTEQVENWVEQEIVGFEVFYRFSEFQVEGNDVTWTVFVRSIPGTVLCVGDATIEEGLISFVHYHDCVDA